MKVFACDRSVTFFCINVYTDQLTKINVRRETLFNIIIRNLNFPMHYELSWKCVTGNIIRKLNFPAY